MPVTSSPTPDHQEMRQLVDIARQAITDYFTDINQPPILRQYPESMRQLGACFVTLEVNQQLQGCLGSIIAHTPLVEEVYHKARSAAYQDYRFSPLTTPQLSQLTIEVSVLSPLKTIAFEQEQDLVHYLDHHPVGVMLTEGSRRAVFLPQVWEQLPTTKEFLRHLKIKGGWPGHYWSSSMRVEIFTVTREKEPYQMSSV